MNRSVEQRHALDLSEHLLARRKSQRFSRFEIMCLLEGGMTLTDDAGVEHKFHAPDVLLELPDAVNAWTSTEDVRKYYFIFEA